jgi:hypothetical protein
MNKEISEKRIEKGISSLLQKLVFYPILSFLSKSTKSTKMTTQ